MCDNGEVTILECFDILSGAIKLAFPAGDDGAYNSGNKFPTRNGYWDSEKLSSRDHTENVENS